MQRVGPAQYTSAGAVRVQTAEDPDDDHLPVCRTLSPWGVKARLYHALAL